VDGTRAFKEHVAIWVAANVDDFFGPDPVKCRGEPRKYSAFGINRA
jgi:hypothetical protein